MGTKLSHASRTELADSMRKRYQSSSDETKKLILSEFIAATGYYPKYAIHLLNAEGTGCPRPLEHHVRFESVSLVFATPRLIFILETKSKEFQSRVNEVGR